MLSKEHWGGLNIYRLSIALRQWIAQSLLFLFSPMDLKNTHLNSLPGPQSLCRKSENHFLFTLDFALFSSVLSVVPLLRLEQVHRGLPGRINLGLSLCLDVEKHKVQRFGA